MTTFNRITKGEVTLDSKFTSLESRKKLESIVLNLCEAMAISDIYYISHNNQIYYSLSKSDKFLTAQSFILKLSTLLTLRTKVNENYKPLFSNKI